MRAIRKITAAEENFRAKPLPNAPHIAFVKRNPVEPVKVGTFVALLFRVTGYSQDCDGSLMATPGRLRSAIR